MTLNQLIYEIGDLALQKNLVNAYMGGGSIYTANAETVRSYPFIYLTPPGDHTVTDQTITFSLVIYYVDRLTEENRNETDIYSNAINTLINLGRQIKDIPGVLRVYIDRLRNFTDTEKLADRCAGGYMYVRVECPLDQICAEYID